MRVLIDKDGSVRFLHDDEVAEALIDLGPQRVARASEVDHDGTGWVADMEKSGHACKLGPFPTRTEALDREREFLEDAGLPEPPRKAE